MSDNELPKLPAIQFYPADWLNDQRVQSLSWRDKAVWFELLFIMHMSEERGMLVLNGKKMSNTYIAKQLGIHIDSLRKSLSNIVESGVAYTDKRGIIYNKRMVKDEDLRKIRVAAGLKGGNPVLMKEKDKPPQQVKTAPSTLPGSAKINVEHVQQLRQLCTENNDWLQQTAVVTNIPLPLVKYFCDDWITGASLRHLTGKYSTDVLISFMLKDLDKAKPNLLPKPVKEENIHDRWY